MGFDFHEILTAFLVLFVVIDAPGTIPIVIRLRDKAVEIQPGKASIIAGTIMLLFLFSGERILSLIGVDLYSFAVAGSFILFFLAVEMILGIELYKLDESKALSIVPLAFPLIAGAGSITSILSLHAQYKTQNIAVAIIINLLVVYTALRLSDTIKNRLGQGGISVLQKVFGIILLAIAVKMFTSNINYLIDC